MLVRIVCCNYVFVIVGDDVEGYGFGLVWVCCIVCFKEFFGDGGGDGNC